MTHEKQHCPTCGASVKVISSDEGTCYYEPVNHWTDEDILEAFTAGACSIDNFGRPTDSYDAWFPRYKQSKQAKQ